MTLKRLTMFRSCCDVGAIVENTVTRLIVGGSRVKKAGKEIYTIAAREEAQGDTMTHTFKCAHRPQSRVNARDILAIVIRN